MQVNTTLLLGTTNKKSVQPVQTAVPSPRTIQKAKKMANLFSSNATEASIYAYLQVPPLA
jgi:hypothetical protein